MIYLIYIAGGGAIGAVARYLITNFYKIFFPDFPIGTLFVNFFGSFIIGILAINLEKQGSDHSFIKYFLIIGLLGSFTTFSTFSLEVIELFNERKFFSSFLYIFLSIFLCVSGAYIGYSINRV